MLLGQEAQLLFGLDALGNDGDAEPPTETYDGANDGAGLFGPTDRLNEALVDLEGVHGQRLQM